MPTELIDEIKVGKRFRTDAGDIDALAESMGTALLHPIVVDEQNRLIAGWRRLRAAKKLGWKTIPVTVVKTLDDALLNLRAQRDENTCRKDFTPGEFVGVAAALEPLEAKAAAERKAEGQKAGGPRGGRGK